MKYLSTTLATLALILSQPASGFAEDKPAENEGSGIMHHGKETLDSLQGNGRVTLEGTHIKNALKVNGSLFGHKASVGSLDVGGHAHLVKSEVLGKSHVSGFFSAEKSNFKDTIVLTGQKLTLQNCRVKAIHVKNTHWPWMSQVVELSKHSVCKVNITFDSGKGRVILKDKSTLHGKAKGAVVEKNKQKK